MYNGKMKALMYNICIKCEGLKPILILRFKKITSAGKESKDITWNTPIRLLIYVSINQF